jgi:esterase/lipase superfamily enzyme
MAEKVSFAGEVRFATGSAALDAAAKETLNALVARLHGLSPEVLIVVGHSEARGPMAERLALSQERAKAVKRHLSGRGVDAGRIYTEAKGSTQPLADKTSTAGRARNNRVEIEVIATRGAGAAPTVPVWVPNDRVPVLYATNRQATGSRNPFVHYGTRLVEREDRDNLQRGVAVVRVPPDRQRGELTRPGWVRVTLERVSQSNAARALGLPEVRAADPKTQFSFEGELRELDAKAFAAELARALPQGGKRQAVLYVHGYANDFAEAAFRTAQIVHDLAQPDFELVPLMFSWPSDPGLGGQNYAEAQRRSEASGYDLARFLREVAAQTDIGTVHLIAHSMGSEVLSHALRTLGNDWLQQPQGGKTGPRFRQIVFAAPDVTPRLFLERIEPAIRSRHSITAYGTDQDLPLWFSTQLNRRERVGAAGGIACIDTVDVTAVASGLLRHSTWAEAPRVLDDLRLLLREGLQPALRGLTPRRGAGTSLWALPRKAAGAGTRSQPVALACPLH